MPSNNTAILGATWSSSPAEYPSIRIRDGQYPAVSRSILQYPSIRCAGSEYCGENTARYCHGHTTSVTQYLHAPGPVLQYHPRGREVFAPPILDLRLRDIGILGQGPCAGSMQYCNKNTCFACLKYWNTAPQHLGYWDTGNTVKYSNSPCLLKTVWSRVRFGALSGPPSQHI